MKKVLLMFAILGLNIISFAAVPADLTNHWNFDEGPDWHDDAFESVCNVTSVQDVITKIDATFTNMNVSNWASGKQFSGLKFDGVNDYLNLNQNLVATLGKTSSLSFWLKTTQKGNVALNLSPAITGSINGSDILWGVIDENGLIGLVADGRYLVKSAKSVTDNNYHHIVITRNASSGTVQIFVDGTLSNSATALTGSRSKAFSSLACITDGTNKSNFFNGYLDQIHIFSRIITSTEVTMLKENHAPKTWNLSCVGRSNASFITPSVFSRMYDVERDTVSVYHFTQPAYGSITHNINADFPAGDGSFTYTANNTTLTIDDSFTVIVEDGKGGFRTTKIVVKVMNSVAGGDGVPVTLFKEFDAVKSNRTEITLNGWRVPRGIDWNGDGLMDILVCAQNIRFYKNIGTSFAPVFDTEVIVKNSSNANIIGSSFAYIDIDGDGKKELIVSNNNKLVVYKNLATAGATPVLDATTSFIKTPTNTDFILPNNAFDLGDWDNDGLVDIVTGNNSGDMKLYLNKGDRTTPKFDANSYEVIRNGSYNYWPRLIDLNGDGLMDFIHGQNWGGMFYYKNVKDGFGSAASLTVRDTTGKGIDVKAFSDGPFLDFADFNGDGIFDIVMGGSAGSKIGLGYGVKKTIDGYLHDVKAIYDNYTETTIDEAIKDSANYLSTINNTTAGLAFIIGNGTYWAREELYTKLTAMINNYSFLKYKTRPNFTAGSTQVPNHLPSLIAQYWIILQYALYDTPTHRTAVANTMGLTGVPRTIFIENGLAIGDNAKSIPAAYGTIRDFQRRHPKELFPDAILTIDQFYGNNRGAFPWTPNSTKNTFGDWAVGNGNEWQGDSSNEINRILGANAASGDYFTFVMGHEVTHSLDGYVNGRANKDLRRRWGRSIVTAAGPDIAPAAGNDGWWDLAKTKENFKAKGYWDGIEPWNDIREGEVIVTRGAWERYWSTGPGAAFNSLAIGKNSVLFALYTRQETLAAQANHHWANARGRLISAADRFRRAGELGDDYEPMKANINEVVHFIDFVSAGMNKVNLVETKTLANRSAVNWYDHYATIERNDIGLITRVVVSDGFGYDLEYNNERVVTNVNCTYLFPKAESIWSYKNKVKDIDVVANDVCHAGNPVRLGSILTQPLHGTVAINNGKIRYTPPANWKGKTSFTYNILPLNEIYTTSQNTAIATCDITIIDPDSDPPTDIRYVTMAGAGDKTGYNWNNAAAIIQLQDMLNETDITEVRLATGTYILTETATIPGGKKLSGAWDIIDNMQYVNIDSKATIITYSGQILSIEQGAILSGVRVTTGYSKVEKGSTGKAIIEDCHFYNIAGNNAILISGYKTTEIYRTQFYGNSGSQSTVGLLDNVQNLLVRGCKFINNSNTRGVLMIEANCGGARVENSLFAYNSCTGFASGVASRSTSTVTNCTFVNNAHRSIGTNGGEGTIITTNSVVCNGITNVGAASSFSYCANAGLTTGTGNINITNTPADYFVSTDNATGYNATKTAERRAYDWSLKLNSRLINVGINGSWIITDKDIANNYRIADGTVDIGAYEFQSHITKPTVIGTLIYNGVAQSPNIATNSVYTIIVSAQTNVGNYTATVTLNDKINYQWADGSTNDLTLAWSIQKAIYNMSQITFADATYIYDGREKTMVIAGTLPTGVSVSYIGNTGTAVGIYNATAKFTGNTTDYELIPDKTATLTITLTKISIQKPTVTGTLTYKKSAQSPTIATNAAYTITGNSQTNVGNYTATVTLKNTTTHQWEDGTTIPLTLSWSIQKASYNMSGVTFASTIYTYDGTEKIMLITGNLPSGVTVTYSNNKRTTVGRQTATARFVGNTTNYNAIASKTAMLTINATTYPVNFVQPTNGTLSVKNGSMSVLNNTEIAHGTNITIVATPAKGYILETLTVNGVSVASGLKYSVTTATSIMAIFSAVTAIEENTTPKNVVFATGKDIVVRPAKSEGVIIIYDIVGKFVDSKVANNVEELRFTITHEGIYLVRIGTEIIKVIIK